MTRAIGGICSSSAGNFLLSAGTRDPLQLDAPGRGPAMNGPHRLLPRLVIAGVLALLASTVPAGAEDIEISQYGVAPGGMPYAIALAKGWFQEEGADVTGI